MLLITRIPSGTGCAGDFPDTFVNGYDVQAHRVSLPMGSRVSVERRVGIFGMRASIEVDHANVERIFVQNGQPTRGLNQLHGGVLADLLQCRAGSAGLITDSIRERPRVFRGQSRLERGRLFWRYLGIELPEYNRVDRVSNLDNSASARSIPTSSN